MSHIAGMTPFLFVCLRADIYAQGWAPRPIVDSVGYVITDRLSSFFVYFLKKNVTETETCPVRQSVGYSTGPLIRKGELTRKSA